MPTAVHFTSQAEVDGYGTVALPGIGEVPALRVNEVNTYEVRDPTLGLPLPTEIFRDYYWLVPGIGKAVLIISNGQSTAPPANFTTAKSVSRVFEASDVKLEMALRPVSGLRISSSKGEVTLDWERDSDAVAYRVETVADITALT